MVEKKQRREDDYQGTEVSEFEFKLETRLPKMEPDPEFIRSLHSRLVTPSDFGLEPQTQLKDLLIAMAVIGGAFLILVSILRAMYEVLRAVGVLGRSRASEN